MKMDTVGVQWKTFCQGIEQAFESTRRRSFVVWVMYNCDLPEMWPWEFQERLSLDKAQFRE
jgi:hypothetical protein